MAASFSCSSPDPSLRRYEILQHSPLIVDKPMDLGTPKESEAFIRNCVDRVSLSQTLVYPQVFFDNIVREFYARLSPDMFDKSVYAYGKIKVRNHLILFSPNLINSFLNVINNNSLVSLKELSMPVVSAFLTGMKDCWINNCIDSSDLTLKYAFLHKISSSNWNPTLSPELVYEKEARFLLKVGIGGKINFGKHVFHILKGFSSDPSMYRGLPFPCLISSLYLQNLTSNPTISASIPPTLCPLDDPLDERRKDDINIHPELSVNLAYNMMKKYRSQRVTAEKKEKALLTFLQENGIVDEDESEEEDRDNGGESETSDTDESSLG